MSLGIRRTLTIATILLLALSSVADAAQSKRRTKKQEEAAPAPTPVDKRDRVVAAPGTPFNGRAYWQAAAQCGGLYFKLGAIHSDGAIRAKVIKPDPTAYAALTKDADTANRSATVFFEAAERFLIADRKLNREEAVVAYDPVANASGERVKTLEAVATAAKPCPDLYQACHGAFPQVCTERGLPN
ncbi:MAG: hypothetical protein WDO17_13445 [Alphaproteobacteria bacterium]